MSLRSFLRAAAPALAVVALGLGLAAPASAAGDAARGKTLGYTCLGCHGIETYKNVYPTFSVPRLRGQSAEYIVVALKAYRGGERSHGTMHAHASSLSDQDIEDVAAYLGGTAVKVEASAAPTGAAPPAIVSQVCTACHGSVGVGQVPMYPTLAGQHADYLAHSLESYRNGTRKAVNGSNMDVFAGQIKPEEIKAVAEFYARQKPALQTVPMKEKPVTAKK